MESETPKPSLARRVAKALFNSGKYFYRLPRLMHHLQSDLNKLDRSFRDHKHRYQAQRDHYDEIEAHYGHAINRLDVRLSDVVHQLAVLNDRLKKPAKAALGARASDKDLLADDHLLDNFYVEFERWFRGSNAEIKKSQRIYVPYFKESEINSQKFPVIDIGCGRGEFVELLHENGIRAIGLDLNEAMVKQVKDRKLEAVQSDAVAYLNEQKSESIMAVTAFHVVEHIPFKDLLRMVDEAYRALARGGMLIFETPNPENLIVGSCNFYADPSHLRPIPPAFLEFVLKTRGFNQVEILRLHPIKKRFRTKDPLVREMAEHVFGAQNYAVIAKK